MIFNIILFKSTGFNLKDIPYNADIITNNYQPHSFDAVWLLQNKGIGKVRITATWDEVDGADYCVIQKPGVDVWYFINSIKMLNENCCELDLTMDALTTIGLEKITELSGWCIRKHPKTDNLFENVKPEPWTPTEELVLDNGQEIKLDYEDDKSTSIVGATFNVRGDYNKGLGFTTVIEGQSENASVVVPLCPSFESEEEAETKIDMVFPDGSKKTYTLPVTKLFYLDVFNTISKINEARSLSLDNGIIASYRIPNMFGLYGFDLANGIPNIGNKAGYVSTLLLYEYQQNVLNKKVFALFNTFTLSSICSGDSKTFEAKDIYHAGDVSPRIGVWADVSPTGNPYFRPEYYQNNNTDFFMECVKGSPWQNTPIGFKTKSGSDWAIRDYYSKNERDISHALLSVSQVGVQTAAAVNPLTMGESIDSAFEAGHNIVDMGFNFADRKRQFVREQAVVAPEIRFPQDDSIQNFIGNSAWLYRVRLSVNDVKRLDKFFSMYGYAVDEELTAEAFHTRKNFNYVQCEDITIKADQSLWIRQLAEAQLSNGVRIWHTAFNPVLYTQANPAV